MVSRDDGQASTICWLAERSLTSREAVPRYGIRDFMGFSMAVALTVQRLAGVRLSVFGHCSKYD